MIANARWRKAPVLPTIYRTKYRAPRPCYNCRARVGRENIRESNAARARLAFPREPAVRSVKDGVIGTDRVPVQFILIEMYSEKWVALRFRVLPRPAEFTPLCERCGSDRQEKAD